MLLVPYDGSGLAIAALERAGELADATGDDLLAITVVPDDAAYARERGWLEQDDAFDGDLIERRLRQQVTDVAPEADFRTVVTRPSTDPVATLEIEIARTVRAIAADEDADVVVVGSENAGRVASPLTSVGSPVSDDPRYDVYIVRHRR
jgi:nucleotide-binding universal stress UspA family protein